MIKQIISIGISFLLGFSASASEGIITVNKTGQGNPMILIHGMACSSDVWSEVADYYDDRYELHIVSIAGFGNKQTLEAPHALKAVRDALIAYVKQENLVKPILMGHSMGGFVSLWAAAEESDLFGKIISVDGLPYFPVLAMPGITAETAGPVVDVFTSGMRNQTPEQAKASQEMMVASMIGDESKREAVVKMGLQSNPEVITQAMREMYTTDIREEVAAVRQPVLVFGSWYGYRQYGTTLESALKGYEAQMSNVHQAEIAMADTALHFIFYDQPEWFFETVDGFLEN